MDHCNATQQARDLSPPVVEDQLSALEQGYNEFAYIVSHDLQAPLRHIREFSRLLLRSMGDSLTPAQEEYAAFLDRGVKKSENMIAALLEYSRVNTRTLPMTPVDTAKIVNEATDELQDVIVDSNANIKIGELPIISADKTQLRSLFWHLLDNALKFRRPDATPQVSITAEETPFFYIFTIADNGIGLPPEYQEQALKLFKTVGEPLASLEKETLGAGLAVAQKIVHRHGGTIWFSNDSASSTPGTTINFSIMRREPKPL